MLFDKLNSSILSLSTDIRRECKKLYIAYKYDTNFVDITVQRERLRLAINAKFDQINDPGHLQEHHRQRTLGKRRRGGLLLKPR